MNKKYPEGTVCAKAGCPFPVHAKYLCKSHYRQSRPPNPTPCSFCGQAPVVSKGLCRKHYDRLLNNLPLDTPDRRKKLVTPCIRCGKPSHARSLCTHHYYDWYRQIGKPRGNPDKQCIFCKRSPVVARDLCEAHYKRFILGKRLDTPLRAQRKRSA